MNENKVKVAVIQAAPILFDLSASLNKMEALVQEACKNDAKVLLFPEAFLPGYPRGMTFGTVVGHRSQEGRAQWQYYWRNALAIPSPAYETLSQMARQAQVFLVVGVIEKGNPDQSLYCSILYFDPRGNLLAKHRKLKPTAAERIIWAEGDGQDLDLINSPYGKMGGLICWENYMPLARMALYQQGIEIYMAPTADSRDSWQATLQHIALEGRCFVLGANQFVTRSMYPSNWQSEIANQDAILCRGGSVIISPLGEVLAGPLYNQEGILYAELDLLEIIRAKLDFDVIGHYARPDVFDFKLKK